MYSKLIINTITPWDEPPRARHQLARALSKKAHVIFIARNRFGYMRLRYSNPEENLTLIEPYFPVISILRYRLPLTNLFYQIWLYSKIFKKYGQLLIVNFDFSATLLPNFFKKVIYYCNDEWINNSKFNFAPVNLYYSLCEKKVISRSNVCITTSKYLTHKLKSINPHTYEIPLGACFSCTNNTKVIQKRTDGKITVGLMGFISNRQVPVSILNRIASYDSFQLVLIGPIEKSFLKKLINKSNIRIFDILKDEELYTELCNIDIGLALYNLKRINRGTTSNKLWQYLSFGKPVIISNLPNIEEAQFPARSVYVLFDDNEIYNTIISASNENSEELVKTRIEFARQNSWDKRAEKLLEIIVDHFN
jgi:hypothetical protein